MRGNLRIYAFGIAFFFFLSVLALLPPGTESKGPHDGKATSAKGENKFGADVASKPASETPSSRSDPKSTSLTKAGKLIKQLFVPATQASSARLNLKDDDEADDPDRPSFLHGTIDNATYLRMREEYTALLRGFEFGKPFDPTARGRAISQMEQQTRETVEAAKKGKVRPEISGTTWTSIGPAPIPNGQTTSVSNPVSGRVTAIAIKATDPNVVYVGTAQGGVYRTLNGGTNWTAIFDGAQSLAIGAIAIAPSDSSIVYVGTGEPNQSADSFFGAGLYRINNAETTANLTGPINPSVTSGAAAVTYNAFTGRSISQILIHPTDPATIFVSTATGIGGIGVNSLTNTVPPLGLRGIFRSTNATSALVSIAFTKLTVTTDSSLDPASPSPGGTGNASVIDMVMEPGNPNNIVAAVIGRSNTCGGGASTCGGIYQTTNALAGSPTFTQTFSLAIGSRISLSINKVSSTVTLYAAVEESASGTSCTTNSGAVRMSTDGGATWSAKLAGGGGFCDGQCPYDMPIAMDPTNASNVYLGGAADGTCSGVFKKSTDGGATFPNSDVGLHADSHAIAVAPSSPAIVYTGNDGGIFKSADSGATWTSLNNTGFNATQFQSVAVHPTDMNFTIGGTQDNGTECQGPCGTNITGWVRADLGDGGFALIDQNAANTTTVTMYHTYFNQTNAMGYAQVTTTAAAADNGWSFYGCGFTGAINNGMGNGAIGQLSRPCVNTSAILFYAPMALGPGIPNTLYFGSDRLWRSTDSGVNVSDVSGGAIVSGVAVSAIGISPQNDNVRVVGLENGKVFATTSGSSTLTDTNFAAPANPNGSTNEFVSRAVIDPTNANTAYVTLSYYAPAGQGIFKTTNLNALGSSTWTASASGIPSIPINALVVDPQNPNHLYAGTDIGVYISQNGGTSWTPFGAGLPRVAVFDMAIQNSNRVLRIATHGRGMWEITLLGPTAAPATISGQVVTSDGIPLAGVTVRLSGAAAATTVTGSGGTYHFANVDTDNFYIVTPVFANYHFSPANRSFSLLGNKTDAVFTATPDAVLTSNAIDTNEYFVRQQYLDFLGREPDQGGFNYWTDRVNQCNGNADCLRQRRIDVSAAFFASREFQETGSFVYRLYRGALGRQLSYGEFSADRSQIVGGPNLDVSKTTFANAFVARAEFIQKYQANTSAESFVDALLRTLSDSAGVDLTSERGNLIGKYNSSGTMNESRALVLRDLGDNAAFSAAVYNPSFVLMEYFGYLQRGPDQSGYDFWLNVLNNREPGNYRGMVCAFITSTEYQRRFGTLVTRTNAECSR